MAQGKTRRPKREQALSIADAGWDALGAPEVGIAGNPPQAERFFRRALELDPDLADAYNGLGNILWDRGRFAEAEAMYRTALDKARDELGNDGIHEYTWWGDIATRPYMRARHNLGLVYWKQGKMDEAIKEFQDLLARNPCDNQGIRFLIGGLYHLKGKVRKAVSLYMETEKRMVGIGDPDTEFNLGLGLYQLRRYEAAILQWRIAFFLNVYMPQVVLNQTVEPLAIWHSSNLAEPRTALSYWESYSRLWARRPAARRFLHLVHSDPDVHADISYFLSLRKALDSEQDFKRRGELLQEEKELTDRDRIAQTNDKVVKRVLTEYAGKPK